MSLQWETEYREPSEDDEADDAFQRDANEDDYFGCSECASEPCLGDWLSRIF